MIYQAIVIYCICDEVVKCLNLKDDIQCKMSTSEIMTFAIFSALHYGCDYKKSRMISRHLHLFSYYLSHSQLVRRIHKIPQHVWYLIFSALQVFLRKIDGSTFIVDSFPIKAYENHKSFRAKIFSGKKYHGYTASKKQYFFGIKVHMIVDSEGIPIEFHFTPGSNSDIKTLKNFNLSLPEGALIFADKAYTCYEFEDSLLEFAGIKLLPRRKPNLKRQHSQLTEYLISSQRNTIETVFSSITSRIPRNIRAATENGFYLKVFFFILAYMVNLYFPAD